MWKSRSGFSFKCILGPFHTTAMGCLASGRQSTFSPIFSPIFLEQGRSDCWEREPVCAGDDDRCSWHSVCDSLLYANTDCRAPHSGGDDDERDWNCYG